MLAFRPWLFILLLCTTFAAADLVDDIVDAIQNAASCTACKALLLPLKGLATLGDGPFTSTIKAVCNAIGVEDKDVCDGAVGQQGPILAYDLRSISPFGQTAEKLCDAVFGLCKPPAVNKYSVPFPKAAPTNPRTWKASGKASFQVVHFSDVHIDRHYTVGAEANCTKPICCRNFADNTKPATVPAEPFGSHGCDTPATLAHSMLEAISATNQFSIFTGDVVEAAVWLTNQKDVTTELETFNNEMATLLGAPVFPALGNHESAPVNSFPRNTTTKSNSQWVFDTQSRGWAPMIGAAAASQVAHFSGSYSAIAPGTNLRIISLNTVYWYKQNFFLYDSDKTQPDPNGILAFAVQELQAAEDAGQRAWIIAHMTPGRRDTLSDQSNYFDQVVQRYRNTIAGQFYGHSHQDEFSIAYADYKNQNANTATSVAWISPALTPRSGNPAFKVYDVDPDTYEIMDSRVFVSDLDDPIYQQAPDYPKAPWKLYYSAREVYGPLVGHPASEPLTPAFWHKITEVFTSNDAAFKQYLTFKKRGYDVGTCEGECKEKAICQIRALRSENNCAEPEPGLNFRRAAQEGTEVTEEHDEECEGVGLGHIFGRLAERVSHPVSPDYEQLKAELREILANA